jgi:lysine/ornithine N-monooxygenase
MFENENLCKEAKKNIPFLYKIFKNYKQKDLRYGECMDTVCFVNFAKEYSIIPNYLSNKETHNIINFIKYKNKSLIPNEYFDFCAFVEIITLISIFTYEKTNKDRKGPKETVEFSERIKTFIKYLREVK